MQILEDEKRKIKKKYFDCHSKHSVAIQLLYFIFVKYKNKKRSPPYTRNDNYASVASQCCTFALSPFACNCRINC